jgi:hypothetical protein
LTSIRKEADATGRKHNSALPIFTSPRSGGFDICSFAVTHGRDSQQGEMNEFGKFWRYLYQGTLGAQICAQQGDDVGLKNATCMYQEKPISPANSHVWGECGAPSILFLHKVVRSKN